MGIQQDQTIDLRDPKYHDKVLSFLQQSGEAEFRGEDPDLQQDFEKLAESDMATESAGNYSWIVRETWAVYRTPTSGPEQYVSSVDVVVPYQRRLEITAKSVLQAHEDLSHEQKETLKDGLANYNPNDDPIEWAVSVAQPAGISFSQFDVQHTFRLKRLGQNAVPNEDAKDAILNRLRANEEHRVELVGSVVLNELPEPASSDHIIEVGSEQETGELKTAENAVKELVNNLGDGCDNLEHWQEKAANIFAYPEFKLTWEIRPIKIGCIRVKLHLPVLYIRSARVQLWVFGSWIKDVNGVIGNIVPKCALRGVGAGIVASLVLFNFAAGVAAFKTVFVECIIESVGQTVACVVPGLMLLTYRTAWNSLW